MQEGQAKMQAQVFTFASSPFVPVAIGFFGLGTGYFIWGGQALFGFPKSSPEVNRTLGLWGFWMPGFMQFLTGIYLLTGLTLFNVFGKAAPLYMASLAFTAYGIHWFAMAYRRYIDSSAQPDGWMAIAFLFLSILGVGVFRPAGNIPVLLRGDCHHFMVCRDRARSACTLTFLSGPEQCLCSRQTPRLFFGILPGHLRNIRRGRCLV